MKRINRNPEKFEIIDLFDAIGRAWNFTLDDKSSEQQFLENISKTLSRNKNNPVLIHGLRVESMLEYVAASLGKCILIKQEDSGEVCSAYPNMRVPDYRIVLEDNEQYLVEIKNCHKVKPSSRYTFKKSYIISLTDYAHIFGLYLKIAIYWSRWNIWTLIPVEKLRNDGDHYSISMVEALKLNEMFILGDVQVGTTPPLLLRLLVDLNKYHSVNDDGQAQFTIGNVEIFCNETFIEDKFERNLAFYLMLYGDWPSSNPVANIEANELISIDIEVMPHEPTPEQGFEIIGSLSSMISCRYNDLTTSKGGVNRLSPRAEPGSLGVLIPSEYKGKYLPLWRFVIQPKHYSNSSDS